MHGINKNWPIIVERIYVFFFIMTNNYSINIVLKNKYKNTTKKYNGFHDSHLNSQIRFLTLLPCI